MQHISWTFYKSFSQSWHVYESITWKFQLCIQRYQDTSHASLLMIFMLSRMEDGWNVVVTRITTSLVNRQEIKNLSHVVIQHLNWFHFCHCEKRSAERFGAGKSHSLNIRTVWGYFQLLYFNCPTFHLSSVSSVTMTIPQSDKRYNNVRESGEKEDRECHYDLYAFSVVFPFNKPFFISCRLSTDNDSFCFHFWGIFIEVSSFLFSVTDFQISHSDSSADAVE